MSPLLALIPLAAFAVLKRGRELPKLHYYTDSALEGFATQAGRYAAEINNELYRFCASAKGEPKDGFRDSWRELRGIVSEASSAAASTGGLIDRRVADGLSAAKASLDAYFGEK